MAWAPCSQHTGATTTTSWLPCDSGIPGNTLSTSMAFPALAMLCLPLVIFTLDTSPLWEGAQAQPPMPPTKTAPHLHSPPSLGQGAVGHLHCSLAPAPTFPRQHRPGDMCCLPPLPSHRAAQPWAGSRHARGSVAVGGPAPLLPPQPGPWLTLATAPSCHKPSVACRCAGGHLVPSLPSHTLFSP